MIERIEHHGRLVAASSLPGETREDDVFPSHPNGIQLSKDRFLILFGTRGYRGADDNLSIVYQVRAGDYNGRLLNEGFIVRSIDDWDPFGDGHRYVRQHGHPVAFGVPKGAFVNGTVPVHANLFAIKWRRVARRLEESDERKMVDPDEHPGLTAATQGVEWMQVRLNHLGDDLEIVQPAIPLRQKGFDAGARLCSADVRAMNQSYTQAVPFNDDASEWADVNHFDQNSQLNAHPRIAALKYRYNPKLRLYEWVETGPAIDDGLFEASLIARGSDGWIIESRTNESGVRAGFYNPGEAPRLGGPIAWMKTEDLFGEAPEEIVRPSEPFNTAPVTSFRFADGKVRTLTGDSNISPYHNPRNPLYMWEIDPDDGFRAGQRYEIFDTVAAGLPIPVEDLPKCEMAKLLPHTGGRRQFILHGVYPRSLDIPSLTGKVVDEKGKPCTGIYYAAVHYTEDQPAMWTFA